MSSAAINKTSNIRRLSWPVALGLILLSAAFIYIWILPLFRPRGVFLWGHYRLKDVYLGIPIGVAMLSVIVVLVAPSRYRRSLSLRLAAISISILGTLFVCDAAYAFGVMGAWRADFWLDQAHISRRYSAADSELGFVRKPGVSWRGYVPGVNRIVDYRTDEQGFRNVPGQQRADVVFIGDSLTEAAQVPEEDTFVQRVAKTSGLSAVNLGRGAYGPQQELIVLERYGLAYKPRAVVWQLFEGNDISDAAGFAAWKKNPQQLDTSLKQRYLDNSFLTAWLTNTRVQEHGGPSVTLRYQDGTVRRAFLRYPYEPGQVDTIPEGFAETARAIEAGYRLCESQGIKLVVVFVPTMVRVMEPYLTFDREEDRSRYLPKNLGTEKNDFNGRMAEFCGKLGCPYIDALIPLGQAAAIDNRNLYIPEDEHLDTRGHEVVAQAVVEWLRTRAIVSQ